MGPGPRSRANGRSFGTPWKTLDIGQVEGDLRIVPVVNSHVVYSLTSWNVPFSRLAPRSGFKWDDRKWHWKLAQRQFKFRVAICGTVNRYLTVCMLGPTLKAVSLGRVVKHKY